MSSLPPGPALLLRNINLITIPPAFFISAALLGCRLYGITVPLWLLPVGAVIAIPLGFIVYMAWQDQRARQKAEALGATLPPVIELNSSARKAAVNKYFRMSITGLCAMSVC